MIALPSSHPISRWFWSWIDLDPKDLNHKVMSSSFALERDALDHTYPEIAEAPHLR